MDRRAFVGRGSACGALLLAGGVRGMAEPNAPAETKPGLTQEINPKQVMAVLGDIYRSGDEVLIDAVFRRWGYQCFHTRAGLKEFALKQRANFQGCVDYINSGRARYWERLDYDATHGIVKVTSRKFGKCVCAYAQCPRPAKALCVHRCKTLQTEFFKTMLGRDVTVRIDEAILLGGKRCRTTVRIAQEPTSA